MALLLAGGGFGVTVQPGDAAFLGHNGRIAFASSRVTPDNETGDLEIFTMNPDGSGIKQLTDNTAENTDPAWSPDGTRIAFTSDRDGDREIYVMKADGGGQSNLTNNGAIDFSPAWSPNGARIAFDTRSAGGNRSHIFTMAANGADRRRLTKGSSLNEHADWQAKP